jgi:ATP synthase protein I
MLKPLDVRPIKTVLYWQLGLTGLGALVFGLIFGWHGALSAFFGGAISLSANGAYALAMRLWKRPVSPGGTLVHLFRAEGIKLLVIAALLILVLVFYQELRPAAFFVTFFVTVLAFSAAFLSQTPQSGS